MTNDVFISYSKNDEATADAICKELEAHHLSCWYAPRNIPSGGDWDAFILDALAKSQVMILVWSSQSDKSKHVKREVAIALDDLGMTLIPFRVEEIVSSKLRYYLGNIQWLDASATSLEDSLQRLVKQVSEAIQQGTHPAHSREEQLQGSAAEGSESKEEIALEQAAETRVRAAAEADVLAKKNRGEEAERQRLQEQQKNAGELERQRLSAEARQQQEAEEARAKSPTGRNRQARIIASVVVLVLAAGAIAYMLKNRAGTTLHEVTTPSGLKYTDLVQGTGATPQRGQTVTVHYVGTLQNGTQFDSSRDRGKPSDFRIGVGAVIRGWDEGLMTMKVGGRRKLVVPPDLGYMQQGRPPDIPGNATLLFDVELLGVK